MSPSIENENNGAENRIMDTFDQAMTPNELPAIDAEKSKDYGCFNTLDTSKPDKTGVATAKTVLKYCPSKWEGRERKEDRLAKGEEQQEAEGEGKTKADAEEWKIKYETAREEAEGLRKLVVERICSLESSSLLDVVNLCETNKWKCEIRCDYVVVHFYCGPDAYLNQYCVRKLRLDYSKKNGRYEFDDPSTLLSCCRSCLASSRKLRTRKRKTRQGRKDLLQESKVKRSRCVAFGDESSSEGDETKTKRVCRNVFDPGYYIKWKNKLKSDEANKGIEKELIPEDDDMNHYSSCGGSEMADSGADSEPAKTEQEKQQFLKELFEMKRRRQVLAGERSSSEEGSSENEESSDNEDSSENEKSTKNGVSSENDVGTNSEDSAPQCRGKKKDMRKLRCIDSESENDKYD